RWPYPRGGITRPALRPARPPAPPEISVRRPQPHATGALLKTPQRPERSRTSKRAVTLRQVAALAKVSAMTVSNFMNGRFQAMSEETRTRIAETVAKLNYRPHSAGRGLRTSAGLLIGMIVVDESPAFLTDPFITQVISGLSNHLNQHGYGLVLQGL